MDMTQANIKALKLRRLRADIIPRLNSRVNKLNNELGAYTNGVSDSKARALSAITQIRLGLQALEEAIRLDNV